MLIAVALLWTVYTPVRLLAPGVAGLDCISPTICGDVDDRLADGAKLYDDALTFVDSVASQIRRPPRVVFCATLSCANTFGLGNASARTTPLGIIVAPRGWQAHYLRHELIHYLQLERLGY